LIAEQLCKISCKKSSRIAEISTKVVGGELLFMFTLYMHVRRVRDTPCYKAYNGQDGSSMQTAVPHWRSDRVSGALPAGDMMKPSAVRGLTHKLSGINNCFTNRLPCLQNLYRYINLYRMLHRKLCGIKPGVFLIHTYPGICAPSFKQENALFCSNVGPPPYSIVVILMVTV